LWIFNKSEFSNTLQNNLQFRFPSSKKGIEIWIIFLKSPTGIIKTAGFFSFALTPASRNLKDILPVTHEKKF